MTAVEMITRETGETTIYAPRSKTKSIVVATDGSDSALAAFKAADLIRARTGAGVHVITVLERILLPIMFPSAEAMVLPPDLDRSREEAQRGVVRKQIDRFDPTGDWSMEFRFGRAAEVIVSVAHEQKAGLIIVGANKHGMLGRLLGEETAMEIARLSDIPLLVASPEMKRLPKRVVVAMDLNSDGLQLAPQALESILDSPTVSSVHVKPRSEFMGIDWAEFDSEYEMVMKSRFQALEEALSAVQIKSDLVVLHGDPAHELADYANFAKAELIVVGVKRRQGRSRAVGGRMASRVVRQATCSVLIVPNLVPNKSAVPMHGGTTEVIRDSKLWSAALREFTARNAGRIVNLEVDDPEFGALIEASRYPLLGVDYDHKDGRLTISLGETRGLDRHLTRSIVRPESVSVLSIDGRDNALSVTHGGGQTLLTF